MNAHVRMTAAEFRRAHPGHQVVRRPLAFTREAYDQLHCAPCRKSHIVLRTDTTDQEA